MTDEDRQHVAKTYGVLWMGDGFPDHATVRVCKMQDGKMRWLVDCERWSHLPMDRDFTPEEEAKNNEEDAVLERWCNLLVKPDSGYGPAEPCPAEIATMQRLQNKLSGSKLVIHDEHFPYTEYPPGTIH